MCCTHTLLGEWFKNNPARNKPASKPRPPPAAHVFAPPARPLRYPEAGYPRRELGRDAGDHPGVLIKRLISFHAALRSVANYSITHERKSSAPASRGCPMSPPLPQQRGRAGFGKLRG